MGTGGKVSCTTADGMPEAKEQRQIDLPPMGITEEVKQAR